MEIEEQIKAQLMAQQMIEKRAFDAGYEKGFEAGRKSVLDEQLNKEKEIRAEEAKVDEIEEEEDYLV